MRPKKRILLAASQEERAGVLRFVLETNGLAITITPTAGDVIELLRGPAFDLLVVDYPFDGCAAVLDAALNARTSSLVLAAREKQRPDCPADDFLIYPTSSSQLLERIKTMSAHKRGPRPLKKPTVSQPALFDIYARRLA